MNAIVRYQPKKAFDFDTFLTAMFLMYARAPRKAEPEIDGFYSLGEIGAAPEKAWTRMTPYSIARKENHGHDESAATAIIDIRT